ncbi:MAG: 6-carboxytetrahydropterin synthase [Acidobacteriia bacterium]|nr:6-carboxytetrahydropterin synthase [Terriglobia bacterium]
MYKVTKELHFCYGHRLLNYQGICMHPHGHNSKVEVELTLSDLDDRHMVVDFGDIKRSIQTWIDDNLDHKMVLHKDDPLVGVLKQLREPMFLLNTNPTAESLARLIFEFAAAKGFPVSEVRLWEGFTSYASYSHSDAISKSEPVAYERA